jgi:hypothetical protein
MPSTVQPSFITHQSSTQQKGNLGVSLQLLSATNETKSTQNLVSRLIDETPRSCMRCVEMQTKLDLTYGLALPINRGYKQQVLTLCCLQIQAMNRSSPSPYPPCGEVPYLDVLACYFKIDVRPNLLSLLSVPIILLGRDTFTLVCLHQLLITFHSH